MWPRVVEVMLGCWLILSPFIFEHSPAETRLWMRDMSCGALVIVLALLSWWEPLRRAHLGIAVVALWLAGAAWITAPDTAPPALQNQILVGLLLAMLAIIPSETNLPPRGWREETGGE